MSRTLAGFLLLLLLLPLQAAAQIPAHQLPAQPASIGFRSGNHPGFGRLVFDLPAGTAAVVEQDDGAVVVRFVPAGTIAVGAKPPRNVHAVALTPGEARFVVAPGAQLRRTQLGTRLVLDIVDPARQVVAPPSPKPRAVMRTARATRTSPPPDRHDDGPGIAGASPVPPGDIVPANPPGAVIDLAAVAPRPLDGLTSTMQIAATPLDPKDPPGERVMLLPFDANVAAAAFRRGASAFVVFDQRRPIDMAGLREDPTFASGIVQLLPSGTVLRFPIDRPEEVALERVAGGWTVRVKRAAESGRLEPLDVQMSDGMVRVMSDVAGGVVAMPDPETGASLLVGTLRQSGRGTLVERRTPEFAMVPTWLGVLVEPVSDQLTFRATASGFALAATPAGRLASAPENAQQSAQTAATADARHFTRRFDFPGLPVDALFRRLQATQTAAAAAPQARTARRLAVAEGMIALGLGAEAQALLHLTGSDDARAADDSERIGLEAIAALLAGRPGEAAGIEDPRLRGSDEINLWRALRTASLQEGAAAAAPVLAADLSLLLSYPVPLRERLLPLVAETLALGGEPVAAQWLVDQRADDQRLNLARAYLLQAGMAATGGDAKPAIEAFARVAQGSDRLVRARAATRGVEVQLAANILSAAEAADALDRLMYSWRGDGREVALRQRIAELRRLAGQWRPALAVLRETEQLFPELQAALRPQLAAIFADAIESDRATPLPALDMVTLAEENADLIPNGEAGQRIASRIADRLAALDLPRRAVPVLQKLIAATAPGLVRAELGARLAAMLQALGDHAGTLDALMASAVADISAPLQESRTLAFARSAAALGDLASATAALAALGSTPALTLRADLLETARDWPAAVTALRALADQSVPRGGKLSESEARVLLRLASAAAQVGDSAVLVALRERDSKRFPPGKLSEMFGVLTAGPIQGVADLPRAAQEAKLARSVPAALKTLTP